MASYPCPTLDGSTLIAITARYYFHISAARPCSEEGEGCPAIITDCLVDVPFGDTVKVTKGIILVYNT